MNNGPIEENAACELCGSNGAKPVFTTRDLNWRIPGEFTVVRCPDCGLKYVNPRPAQSEIWKYYAETFMAGNAEFTEEDMDRMRFIAAPLLKRKPGGSALDIGCGSGRLLYYLKNIGWEVHGVEPRAEGAKQAAEKLGPVIFHGRAEDADFQEGSFDAVTMVHVLEHIYHPFDLLVNIRRFLKPDGVLMAEVPNIESFEARVFAKRWAPVDAPRHLFHFSPRTLEAIIKKAGYSNIKITHGSEYKGKIMSMSESLRYVLEDAGIKKHSPKALTSKEAVAAKSGAQQKGNPIKQLVHSGERTAFDLTGRAAAAMRMGSRIIATATRD